MNISSINQANTSNPGGTYIMSSTGSTNNLHQSELSKFKSMKEMMKIKNE